jgi:Arc/MetJ family transcription regulator
LRLTRPTNHRTTVYRLIKGKVQNYHSNRIKQEKIMQTTIELPDELINQAMTLTNAKTQTQVIILALQQLIKKNKVAELKKFKGKINLDINLDTLRNRNAHFS